MVDHQQSHVEDLTRLSATQLARSIRTGKFSARQVVEAHIERIEKVNPVINAVVAKRYEAARKEADTVDKQLSTAKHPSLPPLLGVPCTVKELIAVQKMPFTSGIPARKNIIATEDAPAVARLRNSGAIILGVTNIAEGGLWIETHNQLYGRTKNPYNPKHTAGGSSGGEGAIVAAGGSPVGLGGDFAGSIRLPAFFNGVFGHKPSQGLVPNTGQYPITDDSTHYVCTGPIARRAEDLMPFLTIIAGPDGQDPNCKPMPLGDPDKISMKNLSVISVEGLRRLKVSADLIAAQRQAASVLQDLGARVECRTFKRLEHSPELWITKLSNGGVKTGSPTVAELIGNGVRVKTGHELLKWFCGRSAHIFPVLSLAFLEQLSSRASAWLPKRTQRLVREFELLKQELTDLLTPTTVLLYPSYISPAPRHNEPIFNALCGRITWVYTGIFNVLGLPVTQVPLGLNSKGLPLGVQVIARHGYDHVSIAVAMALEQAIGGWMPPFERR